MTTPVSSHPTLPDSAEINLDVDLPWASFCVSSDSTGTPPAVATPSVGLSVAVRRVPSHHESMLTDSTATAPKRWLHFAKDAHDTQLLSRYELKRSWNHWLSPFEASEVEGEYWRFAMWRSRWDYPVLLFLGSIVFASLLIDLSYPWSIQIFITAIAAVFFLASVILFVALFCTRNAASIQTQRFMTRYMFTLMPGICLALGIIVTIVMHTTEGRGCGVVSRFNHDHPGDTCIRVMPTNYIVMQAATAVIILRLEWIVPLLVCCQIGAIVSWSTNSVFDSVSLGLFGATGFVTLTFFAVSAALMTDRGRQHFQLAVSVHLTGLDVAEQTSVMAAAAIAALPRTVGLRLQSIADVKRGGVRKTAFDCSAAAVVVLIRVRHLWGAYKGDGAAMARCMHRVATLLDREIAAHELDHAGVAGDDYGITTGLHHPQATITTVIRLLSSLPRLVESLDPEAPSASVVARRATPLALCAVVNLGPARGRLVGSRGARYVVVGQALVEAQRLIPQVPDHRCWMHTLVREELLVKCHGRESVALHFALVAETQNKFSEVPFTGLDVDLLNGSDAVDHEHLQHPHPHCSFSELTSASQAAPSTSKYLSSSTGVSSSVTVDTPTNQRASLLAVPPTTLTASMSVVRFIDSEPTDTDTNEVTAPEQDAPPTYTLSWWGYFDSAEIEAQYLEYTAPHTTDAFRQFVIYLGLFDALLFFLLIAELAADSTMRDAVSFSALLATLIVQGTASVIMCIAAAVMKINNVDRAPFYALVLPTMIVGVATAWMQGIYLHNTFTSNREHFVALTLVSPFALTLARWPWPLNAFVTWAVVAVPAASITEYNSTQGTVSLIAALCAYGVLTVGLSRFHSLEGRHRFASSATAAATVSRLEQNTYVLRDLVLNSVPRHVLPHAVRAILDTQSGPTLPPLRPFVSDHLVDLVLLKVIFVNRGPVADVALDDVTNRLADAVANYASTLVLIQTVGDCAVIVGGLAKDETNIIQAARDCFDLVKMLRTTSDTVGFIAAAGVEEAQGALVGSGASLRYVVVGRVAEQCDALLRFAAVPPPEQVYNTMDGFDQPHRAFLITREFLFWLKESSPKRTKRQTRAEAQDECARDFKLIKVRDEQIGLRHVHLYTPRALSPHAASSSESTNIYREEGEGDVPARRAFPHVP